jgi:hypothetical protein
MWIYSLNITQYKKEKASRHAARSCPAHHCTLLFVRVAKGNLGSGTHMKMKGKRAPIKKTKAEILLTQGRLSWDFSAQPTLGVKRRHSNPRAIKTKYATSML